ncbi:MAG: MFS transporter [Pseudomonadota bacterium]|nr:MFS transporter [Pseudomonadota bacterium]
MTTNTPKDIAGTDYPLGTLHILISELSERYSFYGMKAILVVFMTTYLRNEQGILDTMSEPEALMYHNLFHFLVYSTPIVGAILSDAYCGKYRSIIFFSIVCCLGHLALSLDETRLGLIYGMVLIGIGAGGMKPCLNAYVGDQFTKDNQHLMSKTYVYFYQSVNIGALLSSLLCPLILAYYRPSIAFAVPGIIMLFSTFIFIKGSKYYIHKQATKGILKLCHRFYYKKTPFKIILPIFIYSTIIGLLMAESASSWVMQAQKLNPYVFGYLWLPSQTGAFNSIACIAGAPLLDLIIFPFLSPQKELSKQKKIMIGFIFSSCSVLIILCLQWALEYGYKPSIAWHILPHSFLAISELCVLVTAINYTYIVSDKHLKTIYSALFLFTLGCGAPVSAMMRNLKWSNGDFIFSLPTYFLILCILQWMCVGNLLKKLAFIPDETAKKWLKHA